MSMIGLAASPGTAVLPTCSMRTGTPRSAPVSTAHSDSNECIQAGSYGTTRAASTCVNLRAWGVVALGDAGHGRLENDALARFGGATSDAALRPPPVCEEGDHTQGDEA